MASQEARDFFIRAEAQAQWARDASKALAEHDQVTSELPALRHQVEDLRAERDHVAEDLRKGKAEALAIVQQHHDACKAAIEKATAERDAKVAELRADVASEQRKLDEAKVAREQMEGEGAERMMELAKEIAALETKRDDIKADVERLLARHASV